MAVSGIEAAVDRVIQQLSPDRTVQQDAKEAFLELLEQILPDRASVSDAPAHDRPAQAAVLTSPVVQTSYATAAYAAPSSFLRDDTAPALAQLSDDLEAGDPQYNERETTLRGRLDLEAIERRLRSAAESWGLEYHVEDLNGILRNAGYDSVHLGSSERYMVAVERFVALAEDRYRERAGNVPGSAA